MAFDLLRRDGYTLMGGYLEANQFTLMLKKSKNKMLEFLKNEKNLSIHTLYLVLSTPK